nr:unnamed protein product [Callosobruchus analis]
MNTPGIQPLH